jgi:general secretion pathway protein C
MELSATKLISMDFLPAGLKSQIIQKSPVILLYVLVIVLAYQMAGLSWSVLERHFVERNNMVKPSAEKVSPVTSKSKEASFQNLSNLHLFGKMEANQVAIAVPETAPETSLGLVLYGVFTDPDVKQGSAIIGQKTGDQQHYSVDDKVGSGVWLAEVRNDHVLLKRGGSFEMLKFPKEASTGVDIQSSARVNTPNLSEEKQSFMESVKIIPVFSGKDRKLKGYRLLPKKNRAVYNRLGLRPSDIITSINGIALNDQRESMKVIAELVKAESIEVELDRNGQKESKVISLK